MLEGKLETLSLELAKLKRQVTGPKSERRRDDDTAQASLFASEADPSLPAPTPPPAPPRPAPTPHGRRRPEGEPDEVIAAKSPDACERCGGSLRQISTSTATRVEWRRGHYYTVEVRRPSCACDRCRTVETAPEPSMFALPRSIAGNGLIAHVVVDKFADNIPLNRQVDRFKRAGLELSLSTLCDLVRGSAGLLGRIVDAMRAEQLAGRWLQADDTGMPVLDGTKGQAGTGRSWRRRPRSARWWCPDRATAPAVGDAARRRRCGVPGPATASPGRSCCAGPSPSTSCDASAAEASAASSASCGADPSRGPSWSTSVSGSWSRGSRQRGARRSSGAVRRATACSRTVRWGDAAPRYARRVCRRLATSLQPPQSSRGPRAVAAPRPQPVPFDPSARPSESPDLRGRPALGGWLGGTPACSGYALWNSRRSSRRLFHPRGRTRCCMAGCWPGTPRGARRLFPRCPRRSRRGPRRGWR